MTKDLTKKFDFNNKTVSLMIAGMLAGLVTLGIGGKIHNKDVQYSGVGLSLMSMAAFCGYSQRNYELRKKEAEEIDYIEYP